jgi:alkane 1-monooxygenase
MGEILYVFWFRSIIGSYASAWKIQLDGLKRKGISFWSLKNEMLIFQAIQLAVLVIIGFTLGPVVLLHFLLAALVGILLLETVNYIEHYGLVRQKTDKHRYEVVQPHHSWNSDHILGRVLLFELSRHSDHHYKANRKYQVLRHMENSPQMPTGYPGMILLSLVPPLWFLVMHRRLHYYSSGHYSLTGA